MGLLAAVGVAAGIGLASVDTIDAESGQRVLPTDANAQRGSGYAAPAPIPAPADTGGRGQLDPASHGRTGGRPSWLSILKELSKEAMPVLATLAAVALLCFGVARAGPRVAGPEACALYAVDIQSTSGEQIMAATLARSAEAAQRISAIGGVNTHALR